MRRDEMDDRPLGHKDRLIGRILDEAASEADWAALERLANEDADLWRRLGGALRREQRLRRGAMRALAAADEIEAPIERVATLDSISGRLGGARSWGGWAVAAALLLLLVVGRSALGPMNGGGLSDVQQAGLNVSPQAALEHYLTAGAREGLVLGEGPKLVVESRPAPDGELYEVIFLRQVYERRLVREIYEVSENEAGEMELTPASVYSASLGESL